MTQEEFKAQQRSKEDIELLILELCQRMPYGIKLQKHDEEDSIYTLYSINLESNEIYFWKYQGESLRIGDTGRIHRFGIPLYKPYLFPLSSMTEEQSKIYHGLIGGMFGTSALINFEVLEYFFHKNHLDYRGLIEKGLANDATGLNIY